MAGYTQMQWERKFFQCGARCYYCELPLLLSEAQKEHMTPLARGGNDLIANLVPACGPCNAAKGTMTAPEFQKIRGHLFTPSAIPTAINKTIRNLTVDHGVEKENFSLIDTPSLKHLRKESESISWAWRTPPPTELAQLDEDYINRNWEVLRKAGLVA